VFSEAHAHRIAPIAEESGSAVRSAPSGRHSALTQFEKSHEQPVVHVIVPSV